jgi:hypothetical protein
VCAVNGIIGNELKSRRDIAPVPRRAARELTHTVTWGGGYGYNAIIITIIIVFTILSINQALLAIS